MTVQFDGQEQTLARMGRIQEEPDRAAARGRLEDGDGAPPAGRRQAGGAFRPAARPAQRDRARRRLLRFPRLHLRQLRALRLHAGGLPPLPRRGRASHRAARARIAGGAPAKTRRSTSCARGTSRVDPDHNPPLHPFTASSELLEKCARDFLQARSAPRRLLSASCASRNWSISTTARARRRAATRARFPRRACRSFS